LELSGESLEFFLRSTTMMADDLWRHKGTGATQGQG
jgi:hypothetical protein